MIEIGITDNPTDIAACNVGVKILPNDWSISETKVVAKNPVITEMTEPQSKANPKLKIVLRSPWYPLTKTLFEGSETNNAIRLASMQVLPAAAIAGNNLPKANAATRKGLESRYQSGQLSKLSL